jgi:hypothetical protein
VVMEMLLGPGSSNLIQLIDGCIARKEMAHGREAMMALTTELLLERIEAIELVQPYVQRIIVRAVSFNPLFIVDL